MRGGRREPERGARLPIVSSEVIAIVAVGATLGIGLSTLIISGQRAIRADLRSLGERVARIEGALPFLARSAAGTGERTR